jgi:hypothetical protein
MCSPIYLNANLQVLEEYYFALTWYSPVPLYVYATYIIPTLWLIY